MRNLGSFVLGDDIKYTITTTDEATSATITIKDADGVEQITDQSLSQDSTYVWSTVIQTTTVWSIQKCTFRSKILTGSYDNYEEGYFILNNDFGA